MTTCDHCGAAITQPPHGGYILRFNAPRWFCSRACYAKAESEWRRQSSDQA